MHLARAIPLTTTLAGFVALLLAPTAEAHHGGPVSRVGGHATASVARLEGLAPAPRVDLGVIYTATYFDRTYEGDAPYALGSLGSVLVNAVTVDGGVALRSGTTFSAALPVGAVTTIDDDGARETDGGLGDLGVTVAQDLAALWDRSPDRRVSLVVRVGATAPTGRYRTAALSVLGLQAGPGGVLAPTTYDARASLGAGAWSLSGGARVAGLVTDGLGLAAEVGVVAPVEDTPDDIAWGADVAAHLGATVELVEDVLTGALGADLRAHGADAFPVAPGVTREAGGRSEVGLRIGLVARPTDSLACGVRARLPVWQRADGVQLLETVSVSLACDLGLGLN